MNPLNSILVLLVAFVAVFLEASVNGLRNLLGAQIDLLPALMVYASLSAGLTTVMALSVLGGLWFDTLSANPLGISILPLFLVGYAIHLRRELILRDQLFAQFVLGLIACCAIAPGNRAGFAGCSPSGAAVSGAGLVFHLAVAGDEHWRSVAHAGSASR